MTTKADIFDAYGDNPADALRNWAQVDPAGYAHFERTALERMYHADWQRWNRAKIINTAKAERAGQEGQDHLFTPPPADRVQRVDVRSTLIHDGDTVHLLDLAGEEGAQRLREIVARDRRPAKTSLARCEQYERYAELILAKTAELGRPVSIREALGMAA